MGIWVTQPPAVEGEFGTGPVDLAVASAVLSAPPGFDLPGGAGVIFDRAYRWFMDEAASAELDAERRANFLGAFRAMNNLAVYCMTRITGDPASPQQAYDALLEAERIARQRLPDLQQNLGGVLYNLGELMEMVGRHDEATQFRAEAAERGVR